MLKPSRKMAMALEAVVDIAYYGGAEPVQSQGIAERLNLPRRYLEQVMQQLVRADILKGVRGPRGGYRLARERRRVTVGEIIRVIEGISDGDDAIVVSESELSAKVMSKLWEDISGEMILRLDSVTVHDLCVKADSKKIHAGNEPKGGGEVNFVI